MPPKSKRARTDATTGAAADDGSTDAPPAKRAKAQQAAAVAETPPAGASTDLSPAGPPSAHSSTAATAASVLPSDADEVLKNFQRRCKQTKVSAELSAALRSPKPVVERLQSATKLLLEDEARDGGQLIDLSHRVEGKGSLLLLIIEVLTELEILERNSDPTAQAKREELDGVWKGVFSALPHICALIRTSYDTTIKGPDGKDALALMVNSVIPVDTNVWSYHLAEALLDRGADVNTRFNGFTPLIRWSFGMRPPMDPGIAVGPLLLLEHGVDMDARHDNGTICAHAIAMGGNLPLAEALADAGWLAAADLTLLNNASETALQIAQRKLAENPNEGSRRMIYDLLRDHATLWANEARPVVHRWLSHSLLIPDLAYVVLSFVDGKDRGQ